MSIKLPFDARGLSLTLCCYIFVTIWSASIANGKDEHSPEAGLQDPVAADLVSGWLAEREKIAYAHYVVEGGLEKGADSPSVRETFRIEGWISPKAERYDSEWNKAKGFAGSWILLNDKIISWPYGGGEAVCIGIHESSKRDWKSCARIDPRLASLVGVTAFPDRLTSFQDLRDAWIHAYNYLDLKEVESGVYEFILQNRVVSLAAVEYRTKVRINERKGFSIERMEQYELLPGRDLPGDLICWTDTEWKEISDSWVPVRLSGACYDQGNMTKKADAEFRWITVNEPIPVERFDPSDFAVPDGKVIVDYRSSPNDGVEVGRIERSRTDIGEESDPDKRLEKRIQPNLKAPIPPVLGSTLFSNRLIVVVVINSLLLGALMLAWRRKRRCGHG